MSGHRCIPINDTAFRYMLQEHIWIAYHSVCLKVPWKAKTSFQKWNLHHQQWTKIVKSSSKMLNYGRNWWFPYDIFITSRNSFENDSELGYPLLYHLWRNKCNPSDQCSGCRRKQLIYLSSFHTRSTKLINTHHSITARKSLHLSINPYQIL